MYQEQPNKQLHAEACTQPTHTQFLIILHIHSSCLSCLDCNQMWSLQHAQMMPVQHALK